MYSPFLWVTCRWHWIKEQQDPQAIMFPLLSCMGPSLHLSLLHCSANRGSVWLLLWPCSRMFLLCCTLAWCFSGVIAKPFSAPWLLPSYPTLDETSTCCLCWGQPKVHPSKTSLLRHSTGLPTPDAATHTTFSSVPILPPHGHPISSSVANTTDSHCNTNAMATTVSPTCNITAVAPSPYTAPVSLSYRNTIICYWDFSDLILSFGGLSRSPQENQVGGRVGRTCQGFGGCLCCRVLPFSTSPFT